jgi:exodeoxyribonuclease-3
MASRQEPWTRLVHAKKQPGWVAYNPRTMRPEPLGDDTEHMKILSYNVNGLRNVVPSGQFSALAQRENFDVLCLQETHLKASFVASTSTPFAYSAPYHLFNRSCVA